MTHPNRGVYANLPGYLATWSEEEEWGGMRRGFDLEHSLLYYYYSRIKCNFKLTIKAFQDPISSEHEKFSNNNYNLQSIETREVTSCPHLNYLEDIYNLESLGGA